MRQILYKKRHSLKNRRKAISICEHAEDQECRTTVRKSFIYIVSRPQDPAPVLEAPQVYVHKQVDSRAQQEKFSFKVKGAFYMTRDHQSIKVEFCHCLKIDISWKNKVFSPKKSATLT